MKMIFLISTLLCLNLYANEKVQLKLENAYRKYSPEYLNSKLDVSRTKSGFYSSIASHLPELTLTFGQRRLNEQTGVPPSNYLNSNRRTERSWGIDLNFPIFDRSKYLSIKKSTIEKSAAIESHKFLDQQVTWKVKSNIGSIYIQKFKIINLNKSIKYFKDIVKTQQEGYRLKAVRIIDLEEAKSNLELLRARKTLEENFLTNAKIQLATLLGKSSQFIEESIVDISNNKDEIVEAIKEHYNLKEVEKRDFNDLLKELSFISTVNNAKVEEIQSKYSQSVHWPKVELRGSYSKEGPRWKDIKDPDNSNRTLGLFVSIPIFQFGKAIADNNSVNSLVEQAHNRKRYGVRQIKESSRNTLLQFRREKMRLKILKDHMASRKRLLKAYREAFRLGRETLNELIKQENNFIESEFALIDSMNNLGSLYEECLFLYGLKG